MTTTRDEKGFVPSVTSGAPMASVKVTVTDYENVSNNRRGTADSDRETYAIALATASAELARIDAYLTSIKHNGLLIPISLRLRRGDLCGAIGRLSELIKTLGTH